MSMMLIAVINLTCSVDTERLNTSLETLEAPLLVTHAVDLKSHSGFLPATLAGEEAGVETYFETDPEMLSALPPKDSLKDRDLGAVVFRIGGRETEIVTALYLAAALTDLCGGEIFDAEGGRYISSEEAIQYAQSMLGREDASGA